MSTGEREEQDKWYDDSILYSPKQVNNMDTTNDDVRKILEEIVHTVSVNADTEKNVGASL